MARQAHDLRALGALRVLPELRGGEASEMLGALQQRGRLRLLVLLGFSLTL